MNGDCRYILFLWILGFGVGVNGVGVQPLEVFQVRRLDCFVVLSEDGHSSLLIVVLDELLIGFKFP